MIDLAATFEKYENDEFLKFDRIPAEQRLSARPDLCAFLLLDRLVPERNEMVEAAEYGKVWLSVNIDALAAVVTEDDIVTLIRCGVLYEPCYASLSMSV